MLLFNIIALINSNTYVTFIKKLFAASQIDYCDGTSSLSSYESALSGLFDLTVILEQLLRMMK